jgi:hypothetical protein
MDGAATLHIEKSAATAVRNSLLGHAFQAILTIQLVSIDGVWIPAEATDNEGLAIPNRKKR